MTDHASDYIQSNQVVHLPDDDVLDFNNSDSGKIFMIPELSADRTYRIPLRDKGLHFTFINNCGAANTLGFVATIDPRLVGDTMYGALLNTPAAVVHKDNAADTQLLAISVQGDYVDCFCDGTNWYVSGMSGVVGLA